MAVTATRGPMASAGNGNSVLWRLVVLCKTIFQHRTAMKANVWRKDPVAWPAKLPDMNMCLFAWRQPLASGGGASEERGPPADRCSSQGSPHRGRGPLLLVQEPAKRPELDLSGPKAGAIRLAVSMVLDREEACCFDGSG